MATTVTKSNGFIELTAIDADWSWDDLFSGSYDNGIKVGSIQFNPGEASDRMVIKEGSDAGPAIFDALCPDTEEKNLYIGTICRPVVDFSACTLSAGHKVIIRLLEM